MAGNRSNPLEPPLPAHTVRLTRLPEGIELYFPPLRTPGAALALALFGAACFIPGFFAAVAVAPLAETGASGVMAIWLMGPFIVPFIAFGVLFSALSVYLVANSLTVVITSLEIRSLRRVFGFALSERRILGADVAALDVVAVLRYRWLRNDTPFYNLVVRSRNGAGLTMSQAYRTRRLAQFRNRRVTVAESLRGEAMMEQVKREIVNAGCFERLLQGGRDE
ncbi:MAG TPA: hypothetical protein VKF40_15620 [Burkholderiales bacterium]|nr:hypothetical protein [Burkholderiales bacterium]